MRLWYEILTAVFVAGLPGAAFGLEAGPNPTSTPAAPPPVAAPDAAAPSAQVPNVTLNITAKGSTDVIGKAEVQVEGKTYLSDPTGKVKVYIPGAGPGKVTVKRKGYEKLEVDFRELRPAGEFTLRLYPGQPDDDAIIIVGKRTTSVSRTTVSIDEAAKVAPHGDPAQIVKLLPGVQTTKGGGGGGGGAPGQIVIQGSGPHDSKYYIDDLEVPFIFHAISNLSVIPGDMLAGVEFESAGFGTEYGNATGGIITLRTKNEVVEKPKTFFVFNVPFYSGILHVHPLSETTSLTVGVRRSYIDIFLKEFLSRRNKRSKDPSSNATVAPYFSDGQVQYLEKNDDGHSKLTLLGAYDGVKAVVPLSISSSETGQSNINFATGFANLGYEREQSMGDNWRYLSTPQLYFLRTTADFAALVNGQQTETKLRVPTRFTKRLDKRENIYFGLDPDYTTASTSLSAPQFRSDDPTYDAENAPLVKTSDTERYASIGAWAAIDQAYGPLVVTPGVRASYDGQTRKSAVDPRLRTRYALSEENSLKAAIGQYSEAPQSMEAAKARGNPHLNFIRANHYVIGIDSKWGQDWTTTFDVFYKNVFATIESDAATNYNNAGSVRTRGFEALLRRNLTGRMFGWLAYTYSKSQERINDQAPWRTAVYDQTHILTVVGDYKFTGTWDFGGRYDYNTGATYNTVDHAVFNTDLDKYESRATAADRSAGRDPATNALSLYFGHDVLYDAWKLSMRLGVEEFWFKPQVSSVRYSYNYRYKENVTSGISSVPFFELKGEI